MRHGLSVQRKYLYTVLATMTRRSLSAAEVANEVAVRVGGRCGGCDGGSDGVVVFVVVNVVVVVGNGAVVAVATDVDLGVVV